MKAKSIDQIGCIHTCQGLELSHVGVIIGPDFVVRDGMVITRADHRAKQDSTTKGLKSLAAKSPEEARRRTDEIIKNTYRTLMTRGQKGCYIYCTDLETNLWFKSLISLQSTIEHGMDGRYPGLRL